MDIERVVHYTSATQIEWQDTLAIVAQFQIQLKEYLGLLEGSTTGYPTLESALRAEDPGTVCVSIGDEIRYIFRFGLIKYNDVDVPVTLTRVQDREILSKDKGIQGAVNALAVELARLGYRGKEQSRGAERQ